MENKEKNFVSAVIYVHNDSQNIEDFINKLVKVLKTNFYNSEIICVNDCSTDNSVEIIRNLSKSLEGISISVLNMSYFHGIEGAMTAGVDISIGDFVFEFDRADMDYEPSLIMDVYHRALEGYDIVSASADKKLKLTSKLFYKLFDRFTDLSYEMTTESFRILSRRVINRINTTNKAVFYRKATYMNCGLKTDNILYKECKKESLRESKKEKKYRRKLAIDSIIVFTDFGYKFSQFMTFFMMAVTVFMAFYSFIIYCLGNPSAGWTTTILFLALSFFALFGILTIVIKYLQLIIELIFKRKRYSFESIEKLTK